MKRIVSKPENKFMEVELKAVHFNLKALGEPVNLTSTEIDDLPMLQDIADGHCHQLGTPQWFIMNTDSIVGKDDKEYYPIQFYGR